jgi:hypothetical protein
MKTIATLLYSYFVFRGIIDNKLTNSKIQNVKFISPSNKLKVMKSLKIEWDTLRNGQFPTEQMESCGLSVSATKLSVFKQEIELTSTTDEDITPGETPSEETENNEE